MSTNFPSPEILQRHRPLLLAMEAIGWFHMAGKARLEFLRFHGGEENRYEYKNWHDLETPPFPWESLLEWTKRLYSCVIPNNAWPSSFAAFTEKHADRGDTSLISLLQAAHGIVSGVEKNLPKSTSEYLKEYLNQTLLHMWLSSPWGHPKRNLLADPPEVLTPHGWRQLVAEIRRVLEELRDLGTRNVQDVTLWHRWREQAIGPDSFIRRAFLATLAETRLPNNDVTLWDQSYVAAALFKSAVAGAVLDSSFPWTTDGSIKQKTRWRLLTVAIGTEHYEARAVKIGDWTGAQGAIEEFFRWVAELVEVDLAVGSLLYRDDSVAIFSFPGERFDEEEQERQRRGNPNFKFDETNCADWLQGWTKWLQDQADEIARDLDLETPPHVHLSGPTRSLVPMVKEWQKAKQTVAVPIHRPWNIRWLMPSEGRGHVCPVCGVWLNGDPTNKGKPCVVCRQRRHHRRNDWLRGRLGYDTIWFEEVADRNGRLALVTLFLDVEPWLSGERVDSLRAQAIPEWVRFNRKVYRSIENQTSTWRNDHLLIRLERYLEKRIQKPQQQIATDGILRALIPTLEEEFGHASDASASWERIYHRLVEDRAEPVAPRYDRIDARKRGQWFVFESFRKLPSPGRVYRFWREAEEFFNDLLREFRRIAARSDNRWRVRRLLIWPDDATGKGWEDLQLYNGRLYNDRWQGRQLSLVYVRSLGGFVTASNLARLLRPEDTPDALRNARIVLEDEDEPGRQYNRTVAQARELRPLHAHLGVYAPVIPVELSPLRFRVLVPLEAASECVDLAGQWWQKQFARVWDRLPVQVGVVAFPRLVPYQAVIEAVRNVEDALDASEETWRVQEVVLRGGVVALRLHRPDGRETLRVIPATMPDGREDVFYPYVAVEDHTLRFPRDFRHPEGQVYRHLADLRLGDGLRVAPARVATLFLESTAARFDIQPPRYLEERRYLEDWTQMREVWALLQRVAPSQTAVRHLHSELMCLEQDWRSADGRTTAPPDLWRDTVRAMLAHHLEVRGAVLDALTEAAVDGLLQWALDWHITALKESV